jgi:sugar lactone lactonase YvrE
MAAVAGTAGVHATVLPAMIGAAATGATFQELWGVAAGPGQGPTEPEVVYFSDRAAHRVFGVGADGLLKVVAGTGGGTATPITGSTTQATAVDIVGPAGVAVRGGMLYISEWDSGRLTYTDLSTGVITVLAVLADTSFNILVAAPAGDPTYILYGLNGASQPYRVTPAGVGVFLSTSLSPPTAGGLAFDPANSFRLLISSFGTATVYELTGAAATALVGDGVSLGTVCANGAAINSSCTLASPTRLAVSTDGTLYIAEGNRIRVVEGTTINTYAGTGGQGSSGDGGAARSATFIDVMDMKWSPLTGNLYIVDSSSSTVRKVVPLSPPPTSNNSIAAGD